MNRAVAGIGVLAICGMAALAGFLLARWQHAPRPGAMTAETATAAIVATGIVGRQRPDFSLPDLDGASRNVGEWDGSVLLVNFWATWCPPCRKEIPELVALQDQYRDRGLQVLGIALEKAETARGFASEHGMNYPVLAGEMDVIEVAQTYGNAVGALPYTVIVDRSGKIAFAHAGPVTREQVETAVAPLL